MISLTNIIREVTRDIRSTGPGKRLVIIDSSTGRAVEGVSLLFSRLRYYIVANDSDVSNAVEGLFFLPLSHPYDATSIWLQVKYTATCREGSERQLAEALFHPLSPEAGFRESMKDWLLSCTEGREDVLIETSFSRKEELQLAVSKKAAEQSGMDLLVELSFDREQFLDSLPLWPIFIAVKLNGFEELEYVRVKTELAACEGAEIAALLFGCDAPKLEALITREIHNYLRTHTSIQKFLTSPGEAEFKGPVVAHLNSVLGPKGRKIKDIFFHSSLTLTGELSFYEDNFAVKCGLLGHPDPIMTNISIEAKLRDLTRYRSQGSPSLQDWFKENIERITSEVINKATYMDLLLRSAEVQIAISNQLSSQAESIGYAVNLSLRTNIDQSASSLLNPFSIKIEDDFETAITDSPVRLGLVFLMKINDLLSIEKYLNQGAGIPKVIEGVIRNEVTRYFYSIDAERFYSHFNTGVQVGDNFNKSIEEELASQVSQQVEQEFGAEVANTKVRIIKTPVSDRWKALQKVICHFSITLPPLEDDDFESVVFEGDFWVESVDIKRWQRFDSMSYGIKEIKDYLERSIQANIKKRLPKITSYKEGESFYDIEAAIQDLANEAVSSAFGLIITVKNITRRLTALDSLGL